MIENFTIVDLMVKQILCQVQEHDTARGDDSRIRANEYPMIMSFLGKEFNESSKNESEAPLRVYLITYTLKPKIKLLKIIKSFNFVFINIII